MSNLAILLLAAGASKRMGSPKQLLPWGETHLIEHQINSLRLLQLPLYVVLGANAEEISKVITHKKELCICENKDWSKGMGHSIAFGVSEILSQSPSVEGILIALVDQPFITSAHYLRLINHFLTNKETIIVSESKEGYWSPPVLFGKKEFSKLQQLEGDEGAMKIITSQKEKVQAILCKTNLADMDTPEAYRKLRKDH